MAQGQVCGNDYDKAFQVIVAGTTHTSDSFECSIHAVAPTCAHCGCRIIGHGVEADGRNFCCAHCAKQSAVAGLVQLHEAVEVASVERLLEQPWIYSGVLASMRPSFG
jgi:Zn finger protein HypA/HybF involved in hydrogenase expression